MTRYKLFTSVQHHKLTKTRTGLAQTQLLILGAVIAVLIILSGAGFAIYRSVTSGAEDRAAKDTVDRIIAETENYWQQYALNAAGQRSIEFGEWCEYLNRQFTTGTDLTLRSAETPNNANSANLTNGGSVDVGAALTRNDFAQKAQCGWGANNAQRIGQLASGGQAMDTWQDDGLGNSKSAVLIRPRAQSAGSSANRAWNSARTPTGTKVATNRIGGTGSDNLEVVSVATVSSTGNTFCAVYVLDADDRSHIGVYRYASEPSGGDPIIPGACVVGDADIKSGDDVNNPWPQ